MAGFRNSAAMARCSKCKQIVLTGYEGGSPFTIDLGTLDPTQEVLAYAAKVTTYMLRHASNPTYMSVKYRIPRHIGTAPPTGHTIHRAHPCSARAVPLVETPPETPAVMPGKYSPYTGLPTDGRLPFIPEYMVEPPFEDGRPDSLPVAGATIIPGGAMDLPLAKCEACGLDVTPGTGSTLHIPGQEPWGCHDQDLCPAAALYDNFVVHPMVDWIGEDPGSDIPPWKRGIIPRQVDVDYDHEWSDAMPRGITHGGQFEHWEWDQRRGRRHSMRRTVTVGSGIDEWQDEAD